jgi:hypothetical protein
MKYLHLAIIALVSGLVLTAHAAAPKDSGYLSDYDRLIEGEYLEAYWVDIAQIQRSAAPSMLLGEIPVAGIKHHKSVTVADCVGWLKRDLLERAVISHSQSDAKYRLDLAITHMHPGSSAKRLWAGEFGAGHEPSQLQVEGKVVDIESGKVVATFAERRRSSGALGAKDLGAMPGHT